MLASNQVAGVGLRLQFRSRGLLVAPSQAGKAMLLSPAMVAMKLVAAPRWLYPLPLDHRQAVPIATHFRTVFAKPQVHLGQHAAKG